MWSIFRLFVYVVAGRICAAYPITQIVMLIDAWVTSGLIAPGVHTRWGGRLALVHEFGSETAMVGDGTIAAASVGVEVCDGVDKGAATPPQLTAIAVTTIR